MDICHVYILRLVVWMGYLQSVSSQDTTCYYGWTEFSGHCYYFSDSKLNRDAAIEDCKSRGDANLVTVANQDVNDFIHDKRSSSEPYWIGLRPFDDNFWGWNDGKIDQMITWYDDQTSNSSSCGVFWSDVPAFYTHQCNDHRQYICESDVQHGDDWSPYNGHWYTVITDTATQPEAANYCISLDGYLARLTTPDEIASARSLATGHLWVGLTSLVWDDGTAYNWNNWKDNTHIPHSPCAALDKDTDRWRLNDCHHENYFICSKAPQLQIYTFGGSAEGAPCVFPFIYDETVYYECTSINYDKPWCSTTHNYHGNGKWGNCPTISVSTTTATTATTPPPTTTKTITTTQSVSTSTTLIPTSSSVITTTQSPVQDQKTIADTVAYSNTFLSESQTSLVRSTHTDESAISDGIYDQITTGTTSETYDLTGPSDVESQQLKGLHIVLGIVYGLVGVMTVIDAILAFKYWKLVHTKASDETYI